jgi:hypothetical protein
LIWINLVGGGRMARLLAVHARGWARAARAGHVQTCCGTTAIVEISTQLLSLA